MTRGAEGMLRNVSQNKNVGIEAYKELPGMGRDNCSGIMFVVPNYFKIVKNAKNDLLFFCK